MEEIKTIKEKTIELIDALKATCQTYGMGNDGNCLLYTSPSPRDTR